MKIGRNDPCPCGSGKKYKKCHLDKPLVVRTSDRIQISPEQKYKSLFGYNYELRSVIDIIMAKKYPLGGDKVVFTAFCVGKAYKTHSALLLLCKHGYGQDAAILVRSLIDLLITLLYILKDPTDERLHRYFSYDWVLRKKMFDYSKTKPRIMKLLEERKTSPKPTDDSLEEAEKQAKLAQDKYKYGRDWSDKNIKEMADEVGEADLYSTIYKLQSQIMHTAPRVMNEYVIREENGYRVEVGQSNQWVEESLISAFDCVYVLVGQYDKLLELGYAEKLDDIAKRYSTVVGEINEKS